MIRILEGSDLLHNCQHEITAYVLQDSKTVQTKGVSGYLNSVNDSNAAKRQAQQKQNQPQVQQKQVEQNEVSKSKAPSMGGKGK